MRVLHPGGERRRPARPCRRTPPRSAPARASRASPPPTARCRRGCRRRRRRRRGRPPGGRRRRRRPRAVMPYAPHGMPPPMLLPMTKMSGSRPHAAVAPARAGRERVRLVDHQQRAVAGGELAQPVEEAGLGQHDADVGEGRLGEDRGDVAVRAAAPRPPARSLNSATRVVSSSGTGAPTLPGRATRLAVRARDGEGLVDRAVVAVARRPAPSAARSRARASRIAQRFASVADSVNDHSGMPNRRVELGAHPLGVRRRQHRRDARPAPRQPLRHRRDRRLGAVPGHRPGVAEGEVDVLVAVDVE